MVKRLMYGKIPSITEPKILYLIMVHSATFFFLHSPWGDYLMKGARKNLYRKFCQETFKGYGKGLKLLILVNKGIS